MERESGREIWRNLAELKIDFQCCLIPFWIKTSARSVVDKGEDKIRVLNAAMDAKYK